MDIEAVRRLQRAIDLAVQKYDCALWKSIELDRGSEVTDLALNARVRVHFSGGRMRGFTILAKEFVEWVFAPERVGNPYAPEFNDVYTTGGPLVIVHEITGDSIVRAVIHYLELEEGRAGY
jgi:hypothetical protein